MIPDHAARPVDELRDLLDRDRLTRERQQACERGDHHWRRDTRFGVPLVYCGRCGRPR